MYIYTYMMYMSAKCINVNRQKNYIHLTSSLTSCPTVSYQENQKDASYITVSSRPTPDSQPSTRIVKSMSLKVAIAKGTIVLLGENSQPGKANKPDVFEVNKFFRRLSFKRQVRQTDMTDMSDEEG